MLEHQRLAVRINHIVMPLVREEMPGQHALPVVLMSRIARRYGGDRVASLKTERAYQLHVPWLVLKRCTLSLLAIGLRGDSAFDLCATLLLVFTCSPGRPRSHAALRATRSSVFEYL